MIHFRMGSGYDLSLFMRRQAWFFRLLPLLLSGQILGCPSITDFYLCPEVDFSIRRVIFFLSC